MKIARNQIDCSDKEYEEFSYLYDLIEVEKRNPNLQWYHPEETLYPLLKKIAESNIRNETMRFQLVALLEQSLNK